jgi:uncharacterized protein (DUF1684 family)
LSVQLELLDWKRRVFDLYAAVRTDDDPLRAWRRWRDVRDDLFRSHPQSPLAPEAQASFAGLRYFEYRPELRVLADVVAAPPERREIVTSGEAPYAFTRFAHTRFALAGSDQRLELYWLDGYGGGMFCSFADATSGEETYGAGRYLLDTVKGADLGERGGRLVLDFNFAYNPSCAYDPRWVCPLVPSANRLTVPVEAGELSP